MQKILSYKYFTLIISQILIIYVSYINIFPNGYIFSNADVVQYFNFPIILNQFWYTWHNTFGEGTFLVTFSYNLYYLLLYLFSFILNLAPSSQSFLYFFIFLFGSFWSFYYSLNYYSKENFKINVKYKTILSLIYTFNVYTLRSFDGIWGYGPYLFLYILIPVTFGATYKYFLSEGKKINYKILSILGVFFFLSNIANGNLAFFISLNVLLCLFILLLFISNFKKIKLISYLKKTFFYYFVYFLAVFWSVIPQIIAMLKIAKIFTSNQSFYNLKTWLLWQAIKFPSPFFISFNITTYVKEISFVYFLGITLFLFALLSLILNKNTKNNLVYIYLTLLIVTLFLVNKGVGILNPDLIWRIFNNPILLSLRGADKTLIYIPYLLVIIFFLNFKDILEKNKKVKYLLYLFFILSLISTFPFFIGKIQRIDNDSTSKSSSLLKIPIEYFNIASELNNQKINQKIFRIPYNIQNSVNWLNLPKWKLIGFDPTAQLFNSPNVYMNSLQAYFPERNFDQLGKLWNEEEVIKSKWILPFSSFLNIKYLIYHKDVDEYFIKQTQDKIKYYESSNLITKLKENEYFNLYKLNNQYFLPRFYTPRTLITTPNTIATLPDVVSKNDYQIRSVIYLNPQSENNQTSPNDVKDKNNGRLSIDDLIGHWGNESRIYIKLFEGERKSDKKNEDQKNNEKQIFILSKNQAEKRFCLYKSIKENTTIIINYDENEKKIIIKTVPKDIKINNEILGNQGHVLKEINANLGDILKIDKSYLIVQRDNLNLQITIKDWLDNFKQNDSDLSKIILDEKKIIEIQKDDLYKNIVIAEGIRLEAEKNVVEAKGIEEGEYYLESEGETDTQPKGQTIQTPILEFRKINPTKYRVQVHQASNDFLLVFSESFHEEWKIYLTKPNDLRFPILNFQNKLKEYKILDGNKEDQATKEEIEEFIQKRWITTLGNLQGKEVKHKKWKNNKEKLDYIEKYKIDFISKNFQDTIQNDNLPKGHIWDTWFKEPLLKNNHLMANGYANSWWVNTDEIKKSGKYIQNADGSIDFEIIIEFWPQRLFYLGLFISIATLFGCLGYLCYIWKKSYKK